MGLGFILYGNALWHFPIWDDHRYIFGHQFTMVCSNLVYVLNPRYFFWVLPVENSARPAWLASVLLDTCLYRGDVPGYLLSNVLWHCVGSGLIVALVWELSLNRWAAVLAGLLFAAHPLHAEPVNIVSFRSDLMAFVFMALSLSLYLRARIRDGLEGVLWTAGALAACVAALLSKEMAVTLPALLVLTDVLFPERIWDEARSWRWRRWAVYGMFGVVVLYYLIFRTPRSGYQFGEEQDRFSEMRGRVTWLRSRVDSDLTIHEPTELPVSDFMPWERVYQSRKALVFTMSRILASYLKSMAFPWVLQGDYSPPVLDSWRTVSLWAAWAVWGGLLAGAWKLRRKLPLLSYGLFWMPIALIPVSGIIGLLNLQAERYLYIPSAGFCIAVAAGLAEFLKVDRSLRARRTAWAAAAAILGFYAVRTILRNRDYADDRTFLQATNAVDPTVPRVHMNLAWSRLLQGQAGEAEAEYREALRLWPGFTTARLALGQHLMAQSRWSEALAAMSGMDPQGPKSADLDFLRGFASWRLGRFDEAIDFFETASEKRRGFWKADLGAGILLVRAGRFKEAVGHLHDALWATQWRSMMALFYLAKAYRGAGMKQKERRAYEILARESPRVAALYRSGRTIDSGAGFPTIFGR